METGSFKNRVRVAAISNANEYKNVFINYEYLICSQAFSKNTYYIIHSTKENYQHLTGVNAFDSALVFYEKCLSGSLLETDFDFHKKYQSEKQVIGSCRRKIIVLPSMMNLFKTPIIAQEGKIKKNINCSFATTDGVFTLGFINNKKSFPMSLAKGNELNICISKPVDLVLRKPVGQEKFDKMIVGNFQSLEVYLDEIRCELSDVFLMRTKLIAVLNQITI